MTGRASGVPEELVRLLRSGECVAFVGAGFTGAAKLPSWERVLADLAERPGFTPASRAHVLGLLQRKTAHANDEAAQVIEDTMGRAAFVDALRARLAHPPKTEGMERRLRWLRGIPFRAVLTTNFDGVIAGPTPSGDAFREILRPEGQRPWWSRLFQDGAARRVPVLKLHGDLGEPDTVVLTRKDYRELLYEEPGYMAFLRAVIANRPVLYMGFSFTDAYLNELRSEILSMLRYGGQVPPVAYAIIGDVSAITREHYRKHEGIEILSYDTRGGADHAGFDTILNALHDQTNPLFRFGALLGGKRILWVDPQPANNEHLRQYFHLTRQVAEVLSGSFEIEQVTAAGEALARLAAIQEGTAEPLDLVITHWGRGDTPPTAIGLLEGMRRQDLRCPVVVFSTRSDADERKARALSLGAQDYCFTSDGLLRAIERILGPAQETG